MINFYIKEVSAKLNNSGGGIDIRTRPGVCNQFNPFVSMVADGIKDVKKIFSDCGFTSKQLNAVYGVVVKKTFRQILDFRL